MSKQIKLSNDIIALLDKIRSERHVSYTRAFEIIIQPKQTNNSDSNQSVTILDNKIELILKQLEIIKELIGNRTNNY